MLRARAEMSPEKEKNISYKSSPEPDPVLDILGFISLIIHLLRVRGPSRFHPFWWWEGEQRGLHAGGFRCKADLSPAIVHRIYAHLKLQDKAQHDSFDLTALASVGCFFQLSSKDATEVYRGIMTELNNRAILLFGKNWEATLSGNAHPFFELNISSCYSRSSLLPEAPAFQFSGNARCSRPGRSSWSGFIRVQMWLQIPWKGKLGGARFTPPLPGHWKMCQNGGIWAGGIQ